MASRITLALQATNLPNSHTPRSPTNSEFFALKPHIQPHQKPPNLSPPPPEICTLAFSALMAFEQRGIRSESTSKHDITHSLH